MNWYQTTCFDKRASLLYDRHYSRAILNPSRIGRRQFAIANSLVLVTADYSALWVSCWPAVEARNDGQNIWLNQIFRNESAIQSSDLITEAVRITRWRWFPALPVDGLISYIDTRHTASEVAGYCYRRAAPRWHRNGSTTKGMAIMRLSCEQLINIAPLAPQQFQQTLWEAV